MDRRTATRLGSFLVRELLVGDLLEGLTGRVGSEQTVLENVTVLPRFDGPKIHAGVDVTIESGVVSDITPTRVTGSPNRWVVGGLVDAHVHTQFSARQTVLHVLHGVAGVREMCGFPWMLDERSAIERGASIGPRMFVAGHILATHALDGFSTVVKDPHHAREAVRLQAAAGYDAIKVHNQLTLEIYEAVLDEASRCGLPVVGHVPHQVPIGHALRSDQRTLEHLKGYYQDWDLEISTDAWVEATAKASAWNCPTLVLGVSGSRGDNADRIIDSARGLIDPFVLDEWKKTGASGPTVVEDRIFARSMEIMSRLVDVTDRWLAGTDSGGGIEFLTPGIALHREIGLLIEAGLDTRAALHSATHSLGDAHPESGFATSVAPGQPADLVLLDTDPRSDLSTYARPISVVLGGRPIDSATLELSHRQLTEIDEATPNLEESSEILLESGQRITNGWHRKLARTVLEAAGLNTDLIDRRIPRPPAPVPD